MDKVLNSSLFVGIDTHKYEHTAVATNRFEEELGIYPFANTKEGILKFTQNIEALADQKNLTPIFGIEGSGGNGLLLAQRLIADYTWVYEVNPVLTKSRRSYSTKRDKSDKIDAALIAAILTRRLSDLPRISSKTHSQYYLNLGLVVAFEEELVKEQTRIKNQLHRLLHQQDPSYKDRFNNSFSEKALTFYRRRFYGQQGIVGRLILGKLNRLLQVQRQLRQLEQVMQDLIDQSEQQLTSLPGVGVKNAARLLAYIKDIKRFTNVDSFTRYVGCVPEQYSSGLIKKHKRARISNRKLYTTIYSIMLTQLRTTSKAQEYYNKKIVEGKSKKQAGRALMKRISCIIYGMMKAKGVYLG